MVHLRRQLVSDQPEGKARRPAVTIKTDVGVIGAGQAGLSSAYHLKQRGLAPVRDFVVADHL